MTQPGDHGREMSKIWLADDDAIEAIVRGDEVSDHLSPLVAFARGVRAVGDEQVPSASAALAALFVSADQDATAATAVRSLEGAKSRTNGSGAAAALGKVAGLSLLAKIGLGTTVAAATVAGGATGVLPEPAQGAVRGAIEVVTPVEFDDSDPADEDDPQRPENFGGTVSDDANGESDGEKGVDGQEIRDQAPGADNRPAGGDQGQRPAAAPGQTGETGTDRADDTPAGDRVPDDPGNGGATPPSTVPDCGPPHATPASTVPPANPDKGNGPC